MTPVELWAAIDGYAAEKEEREQAAWEQARLIAYYSAAGSMKNHPRTLKDFMPFPWEVTKTRSLTKEEIAYHLARMDKAKFRKAKPKEIKKLIN
jgi:hypothetical protein